MQQALRAKSLYAEIDTNGRSMKGQMKAANKINADFTVIIGEDELAQGQAQIRNMETKGQETVALGDVVEYIESKKKG